MSRERAANVMGCLVGLGLIFCSGFAMGLLVRSVVRMFR